MKDWPKIFQKHSSNQVTKVRQKKMKQIAKLKQKKRTKEIFVKRK